MHPRSVYSQFFSSKLMQIPINLLLLLLLLYLRVRYILLSRSLPRRLVLIILLLFSCQNVPPAFHSSTLSSPSALLVPLLLFVILQRCEFYGIPPHLSGVSFHFAPLCDIPPRCRRSDRPEVHCNEIRTTLTSWPTLSRCYKIREEP